MQNIKFEQREQTRLAFVSRFLPEGVESGHSLLYDWESTSDYVPKADEVVDCLNSYLDLLKGIPKDEPWDVLGNCMMDASELVLAFLGRAASADRATVACQPSLGLRYEIDDLLKRLEQVREEFIHYDACKRLRAISDQLRSPSSD